LQPFEETGARTRRHPRKPSDFCDEPLAQVGEVGSSLIAYSVFDTQASGLGERDEFAPVVVGRCPENEKRVPLKM
jgi:hypothetical protein